MAMRQAKISSTFLAVNSNQLQETTHLKSNKNFVKPFLQAHKAKKLILLQLFFVIMIYEDIFL